MMLKRKSVFIPLVILSLVSLLTATGCESIPENPLPVPTQTPTPQQTLPTPTPSANPVFTLPPVSQGIPLPDFVSVISKVKPSVVAINVEIPTIGIFGQFTQEGAGSGWVLDSNGYIVTNYHVIDGASTISVTLADGRTFLANVVGADEFSDLAVLKIDASNLTAASFGISSNLQIGQWVLAIGNALGLGISATEGIVSRLNVQVQVDSGQTLYDLIQTSAAINPGNSGGPLVNMAGEVIGITSAKLTGQGVEALGYAIASDTARPIIESLVQKGYLVRPWLGISLQSVNALLQARNNLAVNQGAFVVEIIPGSPAEKSGLKVGDIIVQANGKQITSSSDMIQMIRNSQIGQPIEITYYRGKTRSTTSVTPIESPGP